MIFLQIPNSKEFGIFFVSLFYEEKREKSSYRIYIFNLSD